MIKSIGHIAFVGDTRGGLWEYWERTGDVWRQTTEAPVMPDGYRSGRWFARATAAVLGNLSRSSVARLDEAEYEGDISTCQNCGQYHDGIVHKACPSCGGHLG